MTKFPFGSSCLREKNLRRRRQYCIRGMTELIAAYLDGRAFIQRPHVL